MAIKDIKINGKTITEMTIDGNVFKGGSDGGTVASISAVEKHIEDHITWSAPVNFILGADEYTQMSKRDVQGTPGFVLVGYDFTTSRGYHKSMITFNHDLTMDITVGYIQFYTVSNLDLIKQIQFLKGTGTIDVKAGETWIFEKDKTPFKVTLPYDTVANAVIDTTSQLENLDVTYSKSTDIKDGEKIDATVHYVGGDSSVISSTVDVDYKGIEVDNPSKIVTEKEVTDFLDANVVFTGDVGVLDLTKWSVRGTTLYTAHPTNIIKETDVIYIVRANSGFTVNGSTQFEVTYNINDIVNSFTGTFSTQAQEDLFMSLKIGAVPDDTFKGEHTIESITMPGITKIGKSAFAQAVSLKTIDIPKVTYIGNSAFGFSRLTALDLPLVQIINEDAFNQSQLTSINIPKATLVGPNAFYSIVNAASTVVTIDPTLIDTDAKKDEIFNSNWDQITFKDPA